MTVAITPDHLYSALIELDERRATDRPQDPADRLIHLLDRLGRPANDPAHATPPSAPAADPPGPPPPAAPSAPSLYQRLRELVREHDELTRRYHSDFDHLFDPQRVDPERAGLLAAEAGDDEALLARLRAAQLILLKYPIAAQALIAALIAEGRRFAATPEGARWKQSLAGSDLLRRGRAVWEAATLRAFDADPQRPLPSTYLDAFAQACRRGELEPLLARLFTEGPGDAR